MREEATSTGTRRASDRGTLVTFEGIEGCGKTTQVRLLSRHLRRLGLRCLITREPGGTPIGEEIRAILLRASSTGLDPTAELLLYEASRAHHFAERIGPALERGNVVICDRFTDATEAYQGRARGLDRRLVRRLNSIATGGRVPDLTILLDCPVDVGLGRSARRLRASGKMNEEGRFESESRAFHERVRRGYLEIAAREPGRVRILGAEGPPAALSASILRHVLGAVEPRGKGRPQPENRGSPDGR